MNKQITCLLLATETPDLEQTIGTFKNSEIVSKIIIVTPKKMKFEGVEQLVAKTGLEATKTWKLLSEKIDTDYVVIYTKKMALKLGQNALLRMMKVCHDTNAGMVYSDYFEKKEGQLKPHPVIEFQCKVVQVGVQFVFFEILLNVDHTLQQIDSLSSSL